MAYNVAVIGADELAAYGQDNPMFVGHNVIRDAVDARWTSGGTQAGADITTPGSYAYRAYDGRGTSDTHGSGTLSTIYFNVQIAPSTIDTVGLIFLEPFASAEVTVQIANAGTFGGGDSVAAIVGPLSAQTGDPRIIYTSYAATARYTTVEYIRIRFVKDSGNWTTATLPKLAEFFAGQGRVLGIGWGFGSDLSPNIASVSTFEARSGDLTRYVNHHSRHVARHDQTLSSRSLRGGLDDPSTIRTLASESQSFTRPILYIPRPSSAVSRGLLGFVNGEGLEMPQNDYDANDFTFAFDEQPPFRLTETA